MGQSPLAPIIHAIGRPEFAAATANALCAFMEFDSAVVMVHRSEEDSTVIYHNFDNTGYRQGMENYARFTHRINPMIMRAPAIGTYRAREFAKNLPQVGDHVRDLLIFAEDEELGFRTVGWPERQEEIGIHFEANGELVEISLYREHGWSRAPISKLHALEKMRDPLASAYKRHRELSRTRTEVLGAVNVLSPRELEIHSLLLNGCTSKAIALQLNISCHTVKDHRKNIFRKLGVGSLAKLFALHSNTDQPGNLTLEGWPTLPRTGSF
jgi:DNA-binding CsgD family transcriptional regulator